METTEKNMEHGEHFNESIVNEVILEDMKKNRIDHMKYLPAGQFKRSGRYCQHDRSLQYGYHCIFWCESSRGDFQGI